MFPEQTKTPHTALPAEQPLTGASQCNKSLAPAVTRQQPSQQGAQIDAPLEFARLNHDRQGSTEMGSMLQGSMPQGSMLQGSMPQGSSHHDTSQGSHRQGSLKQDSPTQQNSLVMGSSEQGSSRQGSNSVKAMQALDLASIMGAPPEMLAPLLNLIEPLAKQAHQAGPAQQNNHSLHPTQRSVGTHEANPFSQQQGNSIQHNQKASPQQTSCQANSAAQVPPGWIPKKHIDMTVSALQLSCGRCSGSFAFHLMHTCAAVFNHAPTRNLLNIYSRQPR